MDVHEGNPFVIRDSINWRDVRREDQLLELEIRRAERKKPVHEQHTYVTRTMGGNIPRIRQEIARMCSVLTSDDTLYPGPQKNKGIDKSPLDSMNQRDRQNPHQLIESKREIFHLEFALRTRRDEISKLRLRALLFDLKMAEAEKRIIEDSQLFDEFLHATNQSAFEAMKLAENEINRHKEKTKQIKAIKAHICEVRSDICRHEDYYSFKDEIKQFIFLVHLNQSKSDNKPIVMSSAEWKSTWKDIGDTSLQIPFENAIDLREKVEELEDRNLSLIGHFQQSEEEFDEIRNLFEITAHKLDSQIDQLKSHMEVIKSTVDRNDARSEELKFFCAMFAHGDAEFPDQESQLSLYEKEIERVYNESIGQHNLEMHVDSLTMLTFIETRLEDLIEVEDRLPATRVKEEQKERDKIRRIEAREKQVREQDLAQKERALRARNRNAAEHQKRIGRRLVQRSRPFKEQTTTQDHELNDEDDQDAEYFTRFLAAMARPRTRSTSRGSDISNVSNTARSDITYVTDNITRSSRRRRSPEPQVSDNDQTTNSSRFDVSAGSNESGAVAVQTISSSRNFDIARRIIIILASICRGIKQTLSLNIVLHSITLAVLYTAIKYYNPGDEIEEPMAKMSAEIQNLKNELEHIQMKSREAHSMELRSCMKLVGDLREQTDQKLLSTDDKMRQLRTEVHAYMNSLNYDVNGLLEFKNKTATTVKVKFDKWLREELRSDEFKSVIDEHIDKGKEKSSIFNSLTSSFGDLTSSRGDLSTDVVDLITTKIEEYHSDRTGMIDYALDQAGGTVIKSRCSESMVQANSFFRIFGLSFVSYKNSPERAINANTRPGSCWAFSGSRGHLVIKLSRPIIISDLTIEHIPKNISPSGSIQSAPRQFTISALSSVHDVVGFELGNFEYDISGNSIQMFKIKRKMHFAATLVDIRFDSNWGGSYTCIYRVRIHGDSFS